MVALHLVILYGGGMDMKKEYVSKGRLLIAAAVIMLSAVFVYKPITVSAATSSVISSVSNVENGIKIKWNKDTTKKGYYIYRKADTGEWEKRQVITNNKTTSWIDEQVYSGSKYTYKVVAFKGDKTYDNSVTKKTYRIKTPSLTLKSMSAGSFYAVTGYNNHVSGYQIKYSTSKSFTNYKVKTVSGVTGLKKTVDGLSVNKTYYVKVRAFKKVGTKTYYGGYTAKKSVKTKNTKVMYTTSNFTSLYTTTNSSYQYKADVMPPYNSKVTYYGAVESYTSGEWIKLKYNGKVYYMWEPAGGTGKLTSKKSTYTYATSNKYQKAVVELAVDIAQNWKTEYEKGKVGETNSKGVHGFDCSGYVSYVLNTAMQKFVPTYKVSSNVQKLYKTEALYNDGYSNTFSTKVVCTESYKQSKLQPGDVIFFKENSTSLKEIDHCGIYLGNGEFAECTKLWKGVIINPMSDFYKSCFVKAIRMIPSTVKAANDTLYVNTPKTCKVYATMSSTSDNIQDTIQTEAPVTLLYRGTTGTWCYVAYNKNGVEKKGYILSSKLSEKNR